MIAHEDIDLSTFNAAPRVGNGINTGVSSGLRNPHSRTHRQYIGIGRDRGSSNGHIALGGQTLARIRECQELPGFRAY
jgi:hypothetical protein